MVAECLQRNKASMCSHRHGVLWAWSDDPPVSPPVSDRSLQESNGWTAPPSQFHIICRELLERKTLFILSLCQEVLRSWIPESKSSGLGSFVNAFISSFI